MVNLKSVKTAPVKAKPAGISNLALVYEVSKSMGSTPRLTQMLEQVIQLTQDTLNADAASILLFKDHSDDLYFAAISGPVDEELKQMNVSSKSGIAGQVLRTGKPMIVNDVDRSVVFQKTIDETTGFRTRSMVCAPLIVNGRTLGVIEVLNKNDGSDFGAPDLEVVATVANEAAMAIENTTLHQTVLDAYKTTIAALAAAIDAKDPYTRGHSTRVMEYTLSAAATLPFSPEEMETLEYAGILHDVGKIAIDSSILTKPGGLTSEEWNKVREHPAVGAGILQEIPFLKDASELVLCHHERYDGKGYPRGIKGKDIPLGARLLAVADSFDSMTTDRSYQTAKTVEKAMEELVECSGSQFCPVAVEAFISAFPSPE